MTPRMLYFRPQEDITTFELAKVLEFMLIEFPYNFPSWATAGNARIPLIIESEKEWSLMRYLLHKYGIARHFHGVTPGEM
jgi:hypothetical protein